MSENAASDFSFPRPLPSQPVPQFSFELGGVSSTELLEHWEVTTGTGRHGWRDPLTHMRVDVVAQPVAGYRAVEWTLEFTNEGKHPSPVLSKVAAIDATWDVPKPSHANPQVRLFRSRGSTFAPEDFEYREDRLFPGEELCMNAGMGRSSQYWLPFLLTDLGGWGSIVAIGWSGEWSCRVSHGIGSARLTAGMSELELQLNPGEVIRSPRILQLDWAGDRDDAHNQLRSLLLRDYTPRIDGRVVEGPFSFAHWGGMETTEQLARIGRLADEGARQTHFWLDAGWYGADSSVSPNEFEGDWGNFVGDWSINENRHPGALKDVSAAVHAAGMKFVLWVEPGRAVTGTPWAVSHPEWFISNGTTQLLLDFGVAEAREAAVELVSHLVEQLDVDVYREDFNINPEPYWRLADEPGRTGITEIRYIQGLYDFWDELRRRHPSLVIDSCASGGRRLDLESISRTIVLWRTDYQCFVDYDSDATQAQGIGLSRWLPMHGTGTWAGMLNSEQWSTYRARSTYAPAFQFSISPRGSQAIPEDFPWDWWRAIGDEYLRLRPAFVGDFYPLTPGGLDEPWTAYQMYRPDFRSGFVLAFRRPGSFESRRTFQLRGLSDDHLYVVENADDRSSVTRDGASLKREFDVSLPTAESSALFHIRAADEHVL